MMAVASAGTKLFAVGGEDTTHHYLDTVEVLDTTTMKWSSCASMSTARRGLATAIVGNMLFAIGGLNGSPPLALNMVEAYEIEGDSWSQRAPLLIPRTSFAVAGVHYLSRV
jgi:hypothetical protein